MAAVTRTERMWIGGAALLALLIVVVGWFFLISPQRDETADVQSQTADAQTQNLTLQARINRLGDEKKNWKAYTAALAKARQALPDQSNMSLFLRDVQKIAAATSTRVTSLNVGEPTAVTAAATAPATTAPAAPAPTAPPGAAAGSAGGLFAIPIDTTVVGRPAQLSNFLSRLQTVQPRAVLVTSVTRNAAEGGGAALQVKMSAFVAPPAQTTTPTTTSPGGN